MRRQQISWTYNVIAILLIIYGTYFLIREFNNRGTLFISSIIALSIGVFLFLLRLILSSIGKNKTTKEDKPSNPVIDDENIYQESASYTPKENKISDINKKEYKSNKSSNTYEESNYYRKKSSSSNSYYNSYIKRVGYGPVLEINGNRIRDMQNNIYYRIEGNDVYSDYGGLAYIINGKRIRSAYGQELYEVSGSGIYKVFGGYFASIDGSYISRVDTLEKYEYDSNLDYKYILVAAVILFGEY